MIVEALSKKCRSHRVQNATIRLILPERVESAIECLKMHVTRLMEYLKAAGKGKEAKCGLLLYISSACGFRKPHSSFRLSIVIRAVYSVQKCMESGTIRTQLLLF